MNMLSDYRRERSESGFTLIEVLVVVIIIGILGSIAVPVYLNQKKRGAEAAAKQELRTISTLMEAQYLTNETYLSRQSATLYPAAKRILSEAGLTEKMNNSGNATYNGLWCLPENSDTYAFVYWNPVIGGGNLNDMISRGAKTWAVDSTGVIKQITMTSQGSNFMGHTACAIATKDLPGYNKNYWTSPPSGQIVVQWTHDLP